MTVAVTGSTEVVLLVSVEAAWAVLADTPRMIALDPVIGSYESRAPADRGKGR